MPNELLKEIERRTIDLAKFLISASDSPSKESDSELVALEIQELFHESRQHSKWILNDSGGEKRVLPKILPAVLPGLSDYRDLPESPRVLIEEAARQAEIKGSSPLLMEAVRRALMLAETRARVLISGETGTGKELVAKLIHNHSDRRNKPFVVVNCGALESTLAISELFGYEAYSFTGADARGRIGKVAAADGGTLFLDEVADLPAVAQAALLRLLDQGEIQSIGKASPRHVDVRVVSATHKDLRTAIERGEFREDLYYRLFVAEVKLPSLRERGQDALQLAGHILNVLHIEYGRSTPRGLTDDAKLLFTEHSWPGNVRQLKQVLEHAFIENSVEFLSASMFPMLTNSKLNSVSVKPVASEILASEIQKSLKTPHPRVASFLCNGGRDWFSTTDLADHAGLSASHARAKLRTLATAEIVESAGEQRGRRYRLASRFSLDFPSKNSDINSLGELESD